MSFGHQNGLKTRIKGVCEMIVQINGETREIECNQMKLARTMWNKSGDKYTKKEMYDMGFELKEDLK